MGISLSMDQVRKGQRASRRADGIATYDFVDEHSELMFQKVRA
jgi:hypothetical protein